MSLNIFFQVELDFHKINFIYGQKRGKKVSWTMEWPLIITKSLGFEVLGFGALSK
jgi:hypothetical protein